MPKDYILTENDLTIEDGDFAVGETTRQHKMHLLITAPGELRSSVPTGVNIGNYLLDEVSDASDVIREQFENDGMVVDEVTMYANGTITEKSFYP